MPVRRMRLCGYCGTVVPGTCPTCTVRHQRYSRGTIKGVNYGRSWRRLRDHWLAENPWCAACAAQGKRKLAEQLDHIVPHRGDLSKFKDTSNLQGLCSSCHSLKTSKEVQLGGQR